MATSYNLGNNKDKPNGEPIRWPHTYKVFENRVNRKRKTPEPPGINIPNMINTVINYLTPTDLAILELEEEEFFRQDIQTVERLVHHYYDRHN